MSATLLRILRVRIVLTIVVAILFAPRPAAAESRADLARVTVKRFAFEAYPDWLATQTAACPAELDELLPWMNNKDIRDPWGRDYRFSCLAGEAEPEAFIVWSVGEDGVRGTTDDVWSDR